MHRVFGVTLLAMGLAFTSAVSAQQDPAAPDANGQSQPSLGEMARKMRKEKPPEVKMTAEEAKDLFKHVDEVLEFASKDTGFPRRTAVKRQLVGPSDIERFTKERLAKAENLQRFARAELTMKKFGLLPREFDLRDFLVKANGQQVAGLYDEETKTISLLNTVSFEHQGPILAHELTHALQDQNYGLKTWARSSGADEAETARHAVVEGQAMVVYIDFLLAPFGRNLQNTPGVVAEMSEPAVMATIDTEMMHKAPMVLREAGSFPYREGLIFEGEVLAKSGKSAAFAGMFAHPPRNTHEVLEPRAYLERENLVPVVIPDVRGIVTSVYEVYDSGSFGELDVRALLRQFGEKRGASDDLAAAWQGGSYVAFQRSHGSSKPAPATADLALLYLSRWKTKESAERFARFYATTVAKRYQHAAVEAVPACAVSACPVGAAQISTEEGPVIVEEWADNTVIVSESFDVTTAAKLSAALRSAGPEQHAGGASEDELSLRLESLPAFREFEERVGAEFLRECVSAFGER
ncbi:MAG TPA: hypothetical protein VEI01_23675 [Terriglobales bacterium]|nr:hypothetical protein [Terriglobales bacterium]